MLTLAAASVEAYPILQLDILGGLYDASDETIVSDGTDFTLVALLTPQGNHSALGLLDGVFPTFFREFGFSFSPSNRTVSYNSEDNPGGLTPTSATTGINYFATFNVTTALAESDTLHFDLYNTTIRACGRNQGCFLDRDAALNAPFSHDAESSNQKVAEPGSLLLMSIGLLIAAKSLRRRPKKKAK